MTKQVDEPVRITWEQQVEDVRPKEKAIGSKSGTQGRNEDKTFVFTSGVGMKTPTPNPRQGRLMGSVPNGYRNQGDDERTWARMIKENRFTKKETPSEVVHKCTGETRMIVDKSDPISHIWGYSAMGCFSG